MMNCAEPNDTLPTSGMFQKPQRRKCYNIRTYDSDGFRRRAGCICFKSNKMHEVLLISSSKNAGQDWRLPAGGIEPDEEAKKCASRETLEEAGAIGVLGNPLGIIEDEANKFRTTLFTFIVTELVHFPDWEEGNRRERRWFSINEAIEVLTKRPLYQSLLRKVATMSNID